MSIHRVNDILEINHNCRNYCKAPYPNHPNGCPNYNVSEQCPPKISLVENIFDLSKDLYFVVEEFDLKTHVESMRLKHPDWSDLQLKNLLYWQNGVRKKLKYKTLAFIGETDPEMIFTLLPEAMGVMVINTALKLQIPIERNPASRVFKIALVGYPKDLNTIPVNTFDYGT